MFIRNCWYVAGWSTDLPGEGLIARTINNKPILLWRTSRGEVVALEERAVGAEGRCLAGRPSRVLGGLVELKPSAPTSQREGVQSANGKLIWLSFPQPPPCDHSVAAEHANAAR